MSNFGSERVRLGNARFIPPHQLDRQGFQFGDFWLGRTLTGKAFGWQADYSLLTCAGTGAGKGTSVVVPNLLTYPGSAIVIDPKGELADLTAAYRRDVLGHKVVVLDPARSCRKIPEDLRGSYNPLACLEKGADRTISRARTIAEGLVVPNPQATDPFWDDSARDFIQSVILYMVAMDMDPARRTLTLLRELVAKGDLMAVTELYPDLPEIEPSLPFDIMKKIMFGLEDFCGIIGETAAKLSRDDRVTGSVLATAGKHLDFLKEPELWAVTDHCDDPERTFTLPEFRDQQRPLTVYLCLPADAMTTQGAWLRVIVTQIVQYLQRTPFDVDNERPVLMLLDEFAQLGKLSWIVNTLNYARGCGLRLWLIVQDLQQLKTNYPDSWQSIMNACGIKQFFGIDEIETAEYIAKMLGDTEIEVPSVTVSKSKTSADARGKTRSIATGKSRSKARGTSRQISVNEGISTSWQVNHQTSLSASDQQNSGWSNGANTNYSTGQSNQNSRGLTHNRGPHGMDIVPSSASTSTGGGENSGVSIGTQAGTSGGQSSSTGTGKSNGGGHGGGRNYSTGLSIGSSETDTESFSETVTEGDTRTLTVSDGATHGFTVNFKERRLMKPEEVLVGFTSANQLQLVHIRDHGGVLLARTPFFADPFLTNITKEPTDDQDAAEGGEVEPARLAFRPGGMGGAAIEDFSAGGAERSACERIGRS
jgi:type IV secretion system protein VirD4